MCLEVGRMGELPVITLLGVVVQGVQEEPARQLTTHFYRMYLALQEPVQQAEMEGTVVLVLQEAVQVVAEVHLEMQQLRYPVGRQ